MQKIYLPNIQSIRIESFSLYSEPLIEIDFTKAVSCLMGANGIGKSTLLNCINYAITGYVNQPEKKVKSISDFVEGNSYHTKFFDGRISELDKEFACITVEYTLNNTMISVKRNFFPNNLVVEFHINGELCRGYEQNVVRLSNLTLYNQFVFMQLKVLTFDESRDCLFWNQSILTPTLFLCMGGNAEDAEEADKLSREIQKYMSRMRNLQWEITKQSTRLNLLTEESKLITDSNEEDEASIKNSYENIISRLSVASNEHGDLAAEKKLLNAHISELSMKKLKLEGEYSKVYRSIFENKSIDMKHPLILKITQEGCPICGKIHSDLPSKILVAIETCECPLCGCHSPDNVESEHDMFTLLSSFDKELCGTVSSIQEANKRLESINCLAEECFVQVSNLSNEKLAMEQHIFVSNTSSSYGGLTDRIKSLQAAIGEVEKEKYSAMIKRDELKAKHDTLCINLRKIYQDTQVEFLPLFKKLAYSFTGLNLDMSLNSSSDDGRMMFKFTLQIEDSNRDNEFELSESQRFFIDIALRMAIISYVCSDEKQCTMLIDTPEGSLDIAYETNAGAMFSDYINADHKLVLTANLNSSGLVRTLASETGREKFNLISMLKWANLSSVQSSHFGLFASAITEIEKALENKQCGA